MKDELSSYMVEIPKGQTVFSQGDSGNEMYFIHAGKVRIEKSIAEKTEPLAVLEKGDFFGEMSLLEHLPRNATAIVEEDAKLLKIDAGNFRKLLEGNIEIALRMIRKYAIRLRQANQMCEIPEPRQEPSKPTDCTQWPRFYEEKTATSFIMDRDCLLIGRFDPVTGAHPDLDLTTLDPTRSVSRRHARLIKVGDEFSLSEELAVSNGTYVNGKRLQASDSVLLKHGDHVSFAKVMLTFQWKK